MNPTAILHPVIALVLLTIAVAFRMGWARFASIRRGDVKMRYFVYNSGQDIPDYVARPSNNYKNLLEAPVLFYALALALLATEMVDGVYVILAWAFVATRYLHSFIHVAYNHLGHRFLAYLAGVLILLLMWARLAVQLLTA